MAKLTEEQQAELRALEEMSDEEIDFSDIPERDVDWSKARRGLFYQPVKREITLALDEYVIEWFEEQEPDEENRHEAMNRVLLEYVLKTRFPKWGKMPETAVRESGN